MNERDIRIKPINKTIILKLIDYTSLPFSNSDQEEIAEIIEYRLKQKYDIDIESIDIINGHNND